MSLFRLFSGGSSDIEVTAGGTGGQRRSGRGQGGRGTRSGVLGVSIGAGSSSSEAVGDVMETVITDPESTLDEDVSNSIEFSDLGWRTSAGTESFRLRDGNVVGVEAEGDMSLDLGSDSCGGEDLEWYSCAGNEAAYCQAATESHNANAGDGVAGGSGVVPAPYKGQGSPMYAYHECGKMRVGTLNIRGSLRGASEVCVVKLG